MSLHFVQCDVRWCGPRRGHNITHTQTTNNTHNSHTTHTQLTHTHTHISTSTTTSSSTSSQPVYRAPPAELKMEARIKRSLSPLFGEFKSHSMTHEWINSIKKIFPLYHINLLEFWNMALFRRTSHLFYSDVCSALAITFQSHSHEAIPEIFETLSESWD